MNGFVQQALPEPGPKKTKAKEEEGRIEEEWTRVGQLGAQPGVEEEAIPPSALVKGWRLDLITLARKGKVMKEACPYRPTMRNGTDCVRMNRLIAPWPQWKAG